MNLDSKIDLIPKINKPHSAALKKLGIFTVRDLLFYFPYRYLDFSQVKTIGELKADESISIKATIRTIGSRFSFRTHLSIAEAIVSDGTGSLRVTWFNQGYLAKTLKPGHELFLAGTPEYYGASLQLTNPIYEKVSDFPKHTARLVPIYHLTQNIYPKTLRNLIASVLKFAHEAQDDLPEQIITNQKLLPIADTILFSHFPESLEQVQAAKKRLTFEEIFYNQLLAQKHKLELAKKKSIAIPFDQTLVKDFLEQLPFTFTSGQKKATWDILQDLEKPVPMNRLIEGDVGSGKTLVAFTAALEAITAGHQVALLAPTEILARQHFETAKKFLEKGEHDFDDRQNRAPILLTHNYALWSSNEKEKRSKIIKLLAEGMPGLYIGTHALLSDKIKFKNLALVIVDEQHRFGVEQRAKLINSKGKVPHLLSLTATPIPRTLQLAYYGELEISQIKTKPSGRKPIVTKLVSKSERTQAYQFIQNQISLGRQAFVITPLIEESEALEVKSAKSEFEALKKIFPHLTIGLLHGKLKSAEKEQAMADFLAGHSHLLVSTSVVEVGVDVPNASVMVVEGAERFGLAQLHQFRGRVGRAEHQSYCMLFTENENPEVIDRLNAFTKTQDGFALAELDLHQRGFGELYGSEQSGWNFKYFTPSYVNLIPLARQEALLLLKEDATLKKYPHLLAKIHGKTIHFE